MSSSAESPGLVCELHDDSVQGIIDALTIVRWERNQDDAVLVLSEHGMTLVVQEDSGGCHLQATVLLMLQLFVRYKYAADRSTRIGISLGLLVDCLEAFNGQSSMIEFRYPGPEMQLILKSTSTDSLSSSYAEIRTWYHDPITFLWRPIGSTPPGSVGFIVKSSALKEAIDDLKWFGSSIQITLQPSPPSVTFKGEGQVDLEIEFMYDAANKDLLHAIKCSDVVSRRYNYKFLRATTSNMPSSVINDTKGNKLTFEPGGMLRVQYVLRARLPDSHKCIAYVEFVVKPQVD